MSLRIFNCLPGGLKKLRHESLFKVTYGRDISSMPGICCTVDDKTGIATMKLAKKPVNSLDTEYLTTLTAQLNLLEKERSSRGLIITSDVPKIFSAGLDIKEMYKPDIKRLKEFWRSLQNLWIKLYMFPLTTFAAINGHSPAGGCVLAMSCDYRIMASGPYKIGLNETLLGIIAPFWFMDVFKNTVGHRQAEKALHIGALYNPQEALQIGLVDELTDEERLLQCSNEVLSKWMKIPGDARRLTKQLLRKPTVDNLIKHQEADIDNFANFVMQESTQISLGRYIESLKK